MERRKSKERRVSVRERLEEHAKQDSKQFKNISESLVRIEEHIKVSNDFMSHLSWLNEISEGTQLLKRPSLWILAFVIGLVALMGGLKTLIAGIVSLVMPK